MKIGTVLPSWSDDPHRLPKSRLVEYARKAEELDYAGLWFLDHLLKPDTYDRSWLEPLSSLTYIAGETRTIPLGTSILILTLRNPVLLAKQAATVQFLSEGRLDLGLGLGYYEDEFQAAGVPFKERSPRFSEGLELVNRLLTEENVTFEGEFFQVENVTIEPRIGRRPRLLYGGGGVERNGERFVPDPVKERMRVADGWIAHSGTEDMLESDWSDFADHLEAHDQDPDRKRKVGATHLHVVPNADSETATEEQLQVFDEYLGEARGREYIENHYLLGSVDDLERQLDMYDRQNFDQLIVIPAVSSLHELDRQLDHIAEEFSKYF